MQKHYEKLFIGLSESASSFETSCLGRARSLAPGGRRWKHSTCLRSSLRPTPYAFLKYSISDKCVVFVLKSDRDTTAAEAIHKQLIFCFYDYFFFVGMELVSTKPTKPTWSYVSNKKLFIYFFVFFFFLITDVYDCVQRERKKKWWRWRREETGRRKQDETEDAKSPTDRATLRSIVIKSLVIKQKPWLSIAVRNSL